MIRWRDTVNRVLAGAGLTLKRLPVHRFDALDEVLRRLVANGYRPQRVLDAGANLGQWAGRALPRFPHAAFDLIEPQPGCATTLAELARRERRVTVHRTAVSEPGVATARMLGSGAARHCTGAYVSQPGDDDREAAIESSEASEAIEVPATTLDELFAGIETADRALLKLDLEGHEMVALRGAKALLPKIEVVLTEVTFYPVEPNVRPVFADILRFFEDNGFALYEIVALASRPRDGRLRMGDVVFVRTDSPLVADGSWD